MKLCSLSSVEVVILKFSEVFRCNSGNSVFKLYTRKYPPPPFFFNADVFIVMQQQQQKNLDKTNSCILPHNMSVYLCLFSKVARSLNAFCSVYNLESYPRQGRFSNYFSFIFQRKNYVRKITIRLGIYKLSLHLGVKD